MPAISSPRRAASCVRLSAAVSTAVAAGIDRLRRVGDARAVGVQPVGAVGRRRDALRDLPRGRALPRHGIHDGTRRAAHALDPRRDARDRRYRLRGGAADLGHVLADGVGGVLGLRGQGLHFGSDHGEAAARVAGPRGLDRGIERQKIRLSGDLREEADSVADPVRDAAERPHTGGRLLRLRRGCLGQGCGGLRLRADLADRRAERTGGVGDPPDAGSRLREQGVHHRRSTCRLADRTADAVGGAAQRRGAGTHGLDDAGDRALDPHGRFFDHDAALLALTLQPSSLRVAPRRVPQGLLNGSRRGRHDAEFGGTRRRRDRNREVVVGQSLQGGGQRGHRVRDAAQGETHQPQGSEGGAPRADRERQTIGRAGGVDSIDQRRYPCLVVAQHRVGRLREGRRVGLRHCHQDRLGEIALPGSVESGCFGLRGQEVLPGFPQTLRPLPLIRRPDGRRIGAPGPCECVVRLRSSGGLVAARPIGRCGVRQMVERAKFLSQLLHGAEKPDSFDLSDQRPTGGVDGAELKCRNATESEGNTQQRGREADHEGPETQIIVIIAQNRERHHRCGPRHDLETASILRAAENQSLTTITRVSATDLIHENRDYLSKVIMFSLRAGPHLMHLDRPLDHQRSISMGSSVETRDVGSRATGRRSSWMCCPASPYRTRTTRRYWCASRRP